MKKNLLFSFLTILLPLISDAQNFIQRQGTGLRYQGNDIHLRGMAFGNLVWDDNFSPTSHHTEKDFKRIHDLGMNAVRFYMNYKTFESDLQPNQYKQSGWDWIDQNVKWAKANGIYLILNMHVPQGGFQSQCGGDALWTVPGNQQRLASLWKAIAARYQNEPQIAGYDLLNEPTPSGSIENWSKLAQRIIDSIRSADQNHLIITERALALNCKYDYSDVNNNYPQITENNLMYTVHLYDPFEFTHQNLDWAQTGDGGKYPDNDLITVPGDATYATGNYGNPSVEAGTHDWTYFEGTGFTVTDDTLLFGRVVFLSRNIGNGKVYYDDLELNEYDLQDNLIRTIYKVNPTSGTFWWWSENNTGTFEKAGIGHNDNFSVSVTGNTGNASITCPQYTFRAVKNRIYAINGWMKGENIPGGSTASISTEFSYSPSKTKLAARNYDYLKEKITSYTRYIEDKGFPVYFGEFGTARNTFTNNKGGAQWAADAMHIFDSLGYNFTYHSYKESSFGYYDGWDQPIDTTTENQQLKKVFLDFFGIEPTALGKTMSDSKTSILLFPNPATDKLNININDLEKLKKVEIMDMLGNIIINTFQNQIDVEDLPKGSYILKASLTDGFIYSRFIKN